MYLDKLLRNNDLNLSKNDGKTVSYQSSISHHSVTNIAKESPISLWLFTDHCHMQKLLQNEWQLLSDCLAIKVVVEK